jgi:hypothetical protein
VVGNTGEPVNTSPSILHCTLNPGTGVTVGKANAAAHVLLGAVNTGASGKITTFTVLLGATQEDVPPSENDPAGIILNGIVPHGLAVTYLALTVWQPGVVVVGFASHAPPSILYSTVNSSTGVTFGNVNIASQVFVGADITGGVGYTTKLKSFLQSEGESPSAVVLSQSAICRIIML